MHRTKESTISYYLFFQYSMLYFDLLTCRYPMHEIEESIIKTRMNSNKHFILFYQKLSWEIKICFSNIQNCQLLMKKSCYEVINRPKLTRSQTFFIDKIKSSIQDIHYSMTKHVCRINFSYGVLKVRKYSSGL